MTPEIIDQASALEEMMRENAIQAHRLNHSAVSATHCEGMRSCRRIAGKRIRDARCALIARVRWNFGISRGGCDV